jgi:hypothetical protein
MFQVEICCPFTFGDPLDSFVEVNSTYCEGGGSFQQKSGGHQNWIPTKLRISPIDPQILPKKLGIWPTKMMVAEL